MGIATSLPIDADQDTTENEVFDASKLSQEDDLSKLAKRKLRKAIIGGKTDRIVEILERYNCDVLNVSQELDSRKNDGNTALHVACMHHVPPRSDIISMVCCRPGIGINKKNKAGYTALMMVILQIGQVPELDKNKLPTNRKKRNEIIESYRKETVTRETAEESSIQILLHHGADPTETEHLFNDNLFMNCVKNKRVHLACNILDSCLLDEQKLKIIEHQNSDGQTSLHLAAAIKSLTLINILLKLSISLDDTGEDVLFHEVLEKKDSTGRTVFLQAVYSGSVDIVKVLSDRGSDIHAKDNQGNTAIKVANETLPEHVKKPMLKLLKTLAKNKKKWKRDLKRSESQKSIFDERLDLVNTNNNLTETEDTVDLPISQQFSNEYNIDKQISTKQESTDLTSNAIITEF